MHIRFAIIPSAVVSKQAAQYARQIAQLFPHRFEVDNKKLFPHITLFVGNIPEKNYAAVLAITRKIVQETQSFDVEIKKFLASPGGWVELTLQPSRNLVTLRTKLSKALDKSGLALGVRVKPQFRPHITLARFYSDKKALVALATLPRPHIRFRMSTVGLCLSKSTQVYKIMNSVKLK